MRLSFEASDAGTLLAAPLKQSCSLMARTRPRARRVTRIVLQRVTRFPSWARAQLEELEGRGPPRFGEANYLKRERQSYLKGCLEGAKDLVRRLEDALCANNGGESGIYEPDGEAGGEAEECHQKRKPRLRLRPKTKVQIMILTRLNFNPKIAMIPKVHSQLNKIGNMVRTASSIRPKNSSRIKKTIKKDQLANKLKSACSEAANWSAINCLSKIVIRSLS